MTKEYIPLVSALIMFTIVALGVFASILIPQVVCVNKFNNIAEIKQCMELIT